MAGHHAQRDCSQELRFAGTGCPDAEPVWPHSVLGGLFDVQLHRCTRNRDPDRNTQPIVGPSAGPTLFRRKESDIADSDQIRPIRRLRRIHAACPVAGQPLRARQRSGVTHSIRSCGYFVVDRCPNDHFTVAHPQPQRPNKCRVVDRQRRDGFAGSAVHSFGVVNVTVDDDHHVRRQRIGGQSVRRHAGECFASPPPATHTPAAQARRRH